MSATELEELRALTRRLADVEEIKKLKARYFRYVDLHWWPELRGLFAEDAVFEIGESTTSPGSVDDFLAAIGKHLGRAMSVHHGHMPEIDIIDDESARGIWAMYDLVEPAEGTGYPQLTGYGHYTEEYLKVGGEWRIARLRLTRLKRSVDGEVVLGGEIDGRREFA